MSKEIQNGAASIPPASRIQGERRIGPKDVLLILLVIGLFFFVIVSTLAGLSGH